MHDFADITVFLYLYYANCMQIFPAYPFSMRCGRCFVGIAATASFASFLYNIKYLHTMATVSFYLDTRRMKKNGKFPVKLNVFHVGQTIISTEFEATPDVWDGSGYNKKAQNWQAKNIALRNLINKVERRLFELEDSGTLGKMDDRKLKEDLKRVISGKPENEERKFVEMMREFMGTKAKRSTASCYEGTIRKLEGYDGENYFNFCSLMRIIIKKATRKPLYTISSMLIILFVYIQIPLLGFSKHYHVFVCQTRCYQGYHQGTHGNNSHPHGNACTWHIVIHTS